MSIYRVPSPPAGRPPHPRPRRFQPERSIAPLQSLPFSIGGYLFFTTLVAFAFEAAIQMRFEMPCLCKYRRAWQEASP